MDYYDFKIIITDGDHVRVALILDQKPSIQLKRSQQAFTKKHSKQHTSNIYPHLQEIYPHLKMLIN